MSNVVPIQSAAPDLEVADHVELARRLLRALRQNGKQVVHSLGQTYRYECPVFVPLDPTAIAREVHRFSGLPSPSGAPVKLKKSDIGGIIDVMRDMVADPEFFDYAPPGVAFADTFVVVTPHGIECKEHSPAHRARFVYPCEYIPNARPTAFLAFFAEVFRGDKDASDKVRALREFAGIAMLGLSTRYQQSLVQVGPGANGKSVAASIIEAAMPEGSVSSIPPQGFSQEYRRALLAGKLLNVVNELPEADILDSESLKAIIAGDPTTAREIRQAPFTFRPQAGHLFSANRLPGTADQTHGFWRRFMVLTYNRVFADHEKDPELAQRIIDDELPEIVSWLLQGAQDVLARGGYTVPASSAEAIMEWRRLADQVLAFVEERTDPVTDPAYGEQASSLYSAYRSWATTNGHRPVAANKFGMRLTQLGIHRHRTNRAHQYALRLLPPAGDEE